jgi:hypothetical protein
VEIFPEVYGKILPGLYNAEVAEDKIEGGFSPSTKSPFNPSSFHA